MLSLLMPGSVADVHQEVRAKGSLPSTDHTVLGTGLALHAHWHS